MQEVFVDISEHACGCLERVECRFETKLFGTILVRSMTGQNSRDIEDDGCLFVRERELRRGLVSKSVIPVTTVMFSSLFLGYK